MPRIALIANESESSTLVAAAERLPNVDCVAVAADSSLDQFDAVAFCNPVNGGTEACCNAARNGKHLLVDLATLTSIDDVNNILAASREADTQLMIGQPLRFLPSIQAIRASLDAGQLGSPGVLRIHRWASDTGEDTHQLLIREIDLANWLFGQLPDAIYAIARGPEATPQLLQVHLGFAGGGSALIDVTNALPAGDDYYSLSIIAADGSAYADDHHNSQLLFGGGAATSQVTSQGTLHWTALWREFVAAIEESREPSICGLAAIEALNVTAAIRQSIKSGTSLRRQGDGYVPA